MKCLFIYNPVSGKGKIKKHLPYIFQRLNKIFGDVTFYETKREHDAYEYLISNGENFDYLIMSGGDGTVNEIVSAIATLNKSPILGYIPCGTVNDFARTLKIPTSNIKKALNLIEKDKYVHYDLMSINDKYGVYVCCSGMFTETSYATKQKAKNILGKLAYAFHFLKIWFKQKPIKLDVDCYNKKLSGNFSCFFVINSRSVSGININNKAKLDDGKVDAFFVKAKNEKHIGFINKLRLFHIFIWGLKGTKNSKFIQKYKTDHITINSPQNIAINIDGEHALNGSIDIKVLQNKISIISGKYKKK